jgi:hypothetical protein
LEALARGSTRATKLSADIARRIWLNAQDARRGLVAFAARLTPVVQEGTDRVATLPAHVSTIRNRLASRLAAMLNTYRAAFPRLTRRLFEEIAVLRSELTRRLRGG